MINCPFCLNNENGKCTIFKLPVKQVRNEIDCPFISMTRRQWLARIIVTVSIFATIMIIMLWVLYNMLSTSVQPVM